MQHVYLYLLHFFFNDTATTEIYTLSLHDALPIWRNLITTNITTTITTTITTKITTTITTTIMTTITNSSRSEEHTSELQSRSDLVCRLLLEKKKNANSTR